MSSNIPLPTSVKYRSKSSTRPSFSSSVASANKLRRSNSCDKLTIPKRSLGKKSVATPLSSTSQQRSVGLTPQFGLRRSNSNLTTPASSRSRSRSPFQSGSELRDKKCINEHFLKVCSYLQDKVEQPSIQLKPPHLSVQVFIEVLKILLHNISPTFNCDKANYKESTVNILKALKYPHKISISSLKTVGASHSWPQIVNMWSWLVDLNTTISQFTTPKLDDLNSKKEYEAIKYLCKRYEVYNLNGDVKLVDAEFAETFGQLINVNDEENKKLEEDVAALKLMLDEKRTLLEQQQINHDLLVTELKSKQNEIEQMKAFKSNEDQQCEDLHYEIESLKKRKNKLAAIIDERNGKIFELKETISSQPCSIDKKKEIMNSIMELEQSIDLKYKQIKEKRVMKDEIEKQVLEQKKKIKQEVSEFNTKLMKLSLSDPEMKKFQLHEENCIFEGFKKELQTTLEQLKNYKKESQRIFKMESERLIEINAKSAKLREKLDRLIKTNTQLFEDEKGIKTQLEECSNRIAIMHEKRDEEKREFFKKLENLKASESCEDLDGQLLELKQMKKSKEEALVKRMKESYEFFVKLRSIVLSNVVNLNKIRTDLIDFLTEKLTKASEDQENILNVLEQLRSIGTEE